MAVAKGAHGHRRSNERPPGELVAFSTVSLCAESVCASGAHIDFLKVSNNLCAREGSSQNVRSVRLTFMNSL